MHNENYLGNEQQTRFAFRERHRNNFRINISCEITKLAFTDQLYTHQNKFK